jgi:arylsulfatase A-like enzyme
LAKDREKPAVIIEEHRPSEDSVWGGTHRRDGIVVASGPALKRAAEIEDAQLIDFAPTLLHLFGLPVPEDMDGRVLADAFRPEFLTAHPVKAGAASGISESDGSSGYTDEESLKVEERLQALGYLE